MQDYEALAARSFDEPLDADERATLRVWGDALEAAGDPRGALISLEHAAREQPARGRAIRRAMLDRVVTTGGRLLGDFAPFASFPRALELDWRSGQLYGAFLETRRLGKANKRTAAELLAMLLAAPMAASLRRIHVRVPPRERLATVMEVFRTGLIPRTLEEIVVLTDVRPQPLGARPLDAVSPDRIVAACPGLRLLVDGHRVVTLPGEPPTADAQPEDREDRAALGRALTQLARPAREAALATLVTLGPRAFMFVETLMLLLWPRMLTPQAPVAACLGALGAHARIALPLLAKITGRAKEYDRDTRRAAGQAIAALPEVG